MNNNEDEHERVPMMRLAALSLSVLHHGMANLNSEAVPASWQTVLETSNKYLLWLGGNDPTEGQARHHRSTHTRK